MATCNYQTLLNNAACFANLPPGMMEIIELQLLCEILNATTGGGGGSSNVDGRSANYGGGQPSWNPAAGVLGIAVDTSNNRLWLYYGGAWN